MMKFNQSKTCFQTLPMLSRYKCIAFGGISAALRYAPMLYANLPAASVPRIR